MKVTGAVRELIADFLQNPMKYPKLRIYSHPKYGEIMGSNAWARGTVPPHLEGFLLKKGWVKKPADLKQKWFVLPDGTPVTYAAYVLWKKHHERT